MGKVAASLMRKPVYPLTFMKSMRSCPVHLWLYRAYSPVTRDSLVVDCP